MAQVFNDGNYIVATENMTIPALNLTVVYNETEYEK